ncbi:hypothetical protein LCGC14_2240290 [marine sediment metagenome]|uniref:Radical SAM core domain-containing protein n=1 Tax=marine sediment metagenome TaxID=412755 RepID=A0A0F9D5C6_9ZZZZ
MGRNNCRVVLTDRCNLNCSFCCMKEPDICNSFKWQTALWIAQQRYDEIGITGGEPLLELERLVQFICLIKYFNKKAKVYLYTNGILLTSETAAVLKVAGLDGINWSPKAKPTSEEKNLITFVHVCLMPIRLLIQDEMTDDDMLEFVMSNGMQIKQWTLGDCSDMELEDRFRIDWSNK